MYKIIACGENSKALRRGEIVGPVLRLDLPQPVMAPLGEEAKGSVFGW